MAHPWIKGEDTPRKELRDFTENMKKFNARRKLRRAGTMVIAANRFKNIIKEKKQTEMLLAFKSKKLENEGMEQKQAWNQEEEKKE